MAIPRRHTWRESKLSRSPSLPPGSSLNTFDTRRKHRTKQEYRRLIETGIVPALGQKRVTEVTRADVVQLHHRGRATPTQANRTLAVMSVVFTFAERIGERPDGSNPCRHVERFPQSRRERFLSTEELAKLGGALASYRGPAYHVAAIKLLVFTGGRLDEILGLQWAWINMEMGEARLPDSKTGAKTIHLPPPALEVLAGLPRIKGEPHVLGAGRGEGRPSSKSPGGASARKPGLTMCDCTTSATRSPAWRLPAGWACRLSVRCLGTASRPPLLDMLTWRATR